ncbi:MAG: flagellar basal-body MS-ring/collar protein FliF [Gemmatimonadales bacterium]
MFTDLIERAGGPRRLTLIAIGLGASALILVASQLATAPNWVPALTNVPLQSASELADRLDQAGVKYKLERGGSEINVAEPDLARARVVLAKDGLPGGSRPGLELFDRPSWGWNDFTQRVNFRRALEGELERTIGRMRGIERAEVHLAISEQSAFRRADDHPATASVLLALKQGGTPGPEVVQGIAHLVSSSVDGLAPDNVSIHDETGRQWSEPNDGGSAAGLSSHQLRVQQDVEKYLEHKAEDLVAQMVGPNNARVQVAASLNFDKVERTTQAVDPDRQALASEQKAEITPGAQGGAASTNLANSYDNTKSTEVFTGASGTIRRLTVAVLVNDRLLPRANPKDTMPHYEARTAEELSRIEKLVRGAVGVDTVRGDAVSVVSLPFETPKVTVAPEVKPDLGARVQQYQRPVFTGVGLIFAFILAVLALRPLRARGAQAPRMLEPALVAAGRAPAVLPAASAQVAALSVPAASKFVMPQANTEIRDRVVGTVSQNPESAARLVKNWIKEG